MSKLLILLASYLLFTSNVFAAKNYQEQLIEKSRILNLSQNVDWLNMVYYEKSTFGNRYESIFDSNNFFVSSKGKKNPQLELEATLKSFFNKEYLSFKNSYGNKQQSQCAFKGRYEWLKNKLVFDPKKLKEQQCPDFDKWHNSLNAKSATLIFASSYLNNPASMFGHTFLLINGDNKEATKNILSYAINYSASTNETNGIAFAYKGLFGLYKGQFSTIRYHKMIKKYSNLENRDIWEYDLNLNKTQLRSIITNLWEINSNHANYYFFTENCSYILLRLLKIVNDDIPLRKNLLKWVIPSDTVIDINKAEGLLKNSKYRPARASLINHLMNQMDKNHIKLAKKIALNKPLSKKDNEIFENLDSNKKKFIYDMAYEYLQYYYQKSNGIKKSSMAKSSIKILKKRSKLSGTTNITKIKYPNTDPLLAHYPSKLSIKYGHNNIRGDFAKISTRSAYHDIMDSDDGFLKGAAINVVDFDFDYFFDEDRLKLDQFKLLDITSYSPRNILFKPLSWQLSVGVKNLYISNIDLKLSAFGNFGLGLNFDLDALNSNIIFLINGINYYGKHISTNNLSAIVPEIGIITNLGSKTKIRFTAKHNFFKQETKFNHSEYRISQNYELNKKINLEGYLNKKHYNHFKNDHEFGLGLKYYY